MSSNAGFIHYKDRSDTSINSGAEKTVLVIGYKRQASSLLARCLLALNIFMGDDVDNWHVEDKRLSKSLKRTTAFSGAGELKKVIADYDKRNAIWGFKNSAKNYAVLNNLKRFRNPVLLYICRDPIATARQSAHEKPEELRKDIIKSALHGYLLSRKIFSSGQTAVFISYERLLTHPAEIVYELAGLLGLTVSSHAVERIVTMLGSEQEQFDKLLTQARANVKGHIDLVNKSKISGWATTGFDSPPMTVELLVNDAVVAKTQANLLRVDLVQHNIHKDGQCGFAFDLGKLKLELLTNQTIRIRPENLCMELANSPYTVS